jgi:hypothetical protein
MSGEIAPRKIGRGFERNLDELSQAGSGPAWQKPWPVGPAMSVPWWSAALSRIPMIPCPVPEILAPGRIPCPLSVTRTVR